jgi:hypothetical protein
MTLGELANGSSSPAQLSTKIETAKEPSTPNRSGGSLFGDMDGKEVFQMLITLTPMISLLVTMVNQFLSYKTAELDATSITRGAVLQDLSAIENELKSEIQSVQEMLNTAEEING